MAPPAGLDCFVRNETGRAVARQQGANQGWFAATSALVKVGGA